MVTGPHIQKALQAVGATGGQVTTYDALAAGANDAMKRIGIRTSTEAALFLATMAQESAYFRTTTEYGSGQSYAPYVGRTFEQLTWKDNYAAFGAWGKQQGFLSDATMFVGSPAKLGDLAWAWLGGVYYWTAKRSWSPYTSLIDVARQTGSILAVSRAVNAGNPNSTITPNGMTSRTAMYNAFKALGDAILPGTAATTPAPSAPASSTPLAPGMIPGTAAQAVAAANALWQQWHGKMYCYNWPGLAELGRSAEYWCADFVRLAIRKGTTFDWVTTVGKAGPAYCPALVNGMAASSLWPEVTYANAAAGDVVFYFKNGVAYHTGLVEFAASPGGHDLRTIEGNTSDPAVGSTSMSAGGCLAKKTRDDRYYTMRIFRPPYMAEVPATTPTPTADLPHDDGNVVAEQRPALTSFIAPPAPEATRNPIDELNVSPAFREAIYATQSRTCRVDAYLGRKLLMADLPLDANSSSVKVDASQAVRRQASLSFVFDPHSAEHQRARTVLATRGVELRVEAGYSYGAHSETVPLFQGIPLSSKVAWPHGKVTIECADRMWLLGAYGFTQPIASNPGATFAQTIAWLISAADPDARLIDLTGNQEMTPDVVWEGGPGTRLTAAMELAAAIGAELFKSPVPGCYVLRPITSIGARPRWIVDEGRALISLDESYDDEHVKNMIVIKSERADSVTVQGEWADTDPESPTSCDGPFGTRVGFMTTPLLTKREDLEAAARAVCMRLIGGRLSIDWQQLVNPLFEAGDAVAVRTSDAAYDVVLESFDIPLGSQPATSAKARSLNLQGVS